MAADTKPWTRAPIFIAEANCPPPQNLCSKGYLCISSSGEPKAPTRTYIAKAIFAYLVLESQVPPRTYIAKAIFAYLILESQVPPRTYIAKATFAYLVLESHVHGV